MLSTLAGLSVIVVITQKATELHRFHSFPAGGFLTTLGGQRYKLMKAVVQMKYELLHCMERIVVYVWMWQREEGYEISWVSVVREV